MFNTCEFIIYSYTLVDAYVFYRWYILLFKKISKFCLVNKLDKLTD